MSFTSCAVVINPHRTPRAVARLEALVRRRGADHVVVSSSRDHFLNEVADFASGPRRHLLVWGGDGTAHDAINVIIRHQHGADPGSRKAVGFLRGGSGNGIQDSYEVPFSLEHQITAYAESMEEGYDIAVDLLRVDDGSRPVVGQLIGLGYDARVLKRRNSRRSRRTGNARPGLLNYIISGFATLASEPLSAEEHFRLTLEEGKYALRGTRINAEFPFDRLDLGTDATMVEIGTRPFYGRMFKVCPDVVCNDGFMNLYLFNYGCKLDLVRDFVSLWNGWHARINRRFARKGKPLIQRFEIRHMRIRGGRPFDYHVDGELRACGEARPDGYGLDISVVPTAIRFLVPGEFYRKFHPFDDERSAK